MPKKYLKIKNIITSTSYVNLVHPNKNPDAVTKKQG
jgi:hypothetical protein